MTNNWKLKIEHVRVFKYQSTVFTVHKNIHRAPSLGRQHTNKLRYNQLPKMRLSIELNDCSIHLIQIGQRTILFLYIWLQWRL